MSTNDQATPSKRLGIWQALGSVLAAGFGVQSNRNRERDFKHGSLLTFVILGLIGTVAFVLTVYTVVRLVLKSAGH